MKQQMDEVLDIEVEVTGEDGLDGESSDGRDAFGFTPEEVQTVSRELIEHIHEIREDQRELRRDWIEWRRQMDAEPKQKDKNWPMPNASNVSPPLAQIHGQGIAAELINFFNVSPFFGVDALQDTEQAKADAALLTKYLRLLAESPSDLGIGKVIREVCTETGIMGRCVIKVPYTTLGWKFKDNLDMGAVKSMVFHEGPEIVAIQQEDIYYPKEWPNVHMMPWIIEVFHAPEHMLLQKQQDGSYENVDLVLGSARDSSTEAEKARDSTAGQAGADRQGVHDIAECYFYYDADGDGYVEDHIWTIHVDTGVVLRREYNSLGRRPFAFAFYVKRPGELTARGTGKLCQTLQDEVEGIHNVRNDNMKIANMRMFRMKRAVAESNGEAVYPGKIWLTDSPDDIGTLQLGEVYPSSLQAEQLTWTLAAQATGLSEVQRGFSDPRMGTRDTFRGQAMRSQNAKGIFATVAQEMTEAWNEVGMLVLYQLVANSDAVIERERMLGRLVPDDLTRLQAILGADVTELPSKFAFAVNTAEPDKTQAGQMQMLGAVAGWYQQWAQNVTPLAMQLFSPEGLQMQQSAPEMWKHLLTVYTGSTKLLDRMMKIAGLDDPTSFVPNTKKWDMMLKMMDQIDAQRLGGMRNVTGSDAGAGADQFGSSGDQGLGAGFGGGAGLGDAPQAVNTAGRGSGSGTGSGGGGVQALPSAGIEGSID